MAAGLGGSELFAQVAAGSPAALSRLCRLLDDARLDTQWIDQLYRAERAPLVLGLTGAPGVGKSSLASALIKEYRAHQRRVGVLCVDPTSPFSGGAILGDRIRMQQHSGDKDVFIRSLATRGAMGGLTRSASDIVGAFSLWGADVVIIETVGVGQDELDIMLEADCSVVVLAPGLGDDIQAAKAGILEIADVLVVNKADHPHSAQAVSELRAMLALSATMAASHAASVASQAAEEASEVRVLETIATQGSGISELTEAIERRRHWLRETEGGAQALAEQQLQRTRHRLLLELGAHVQVALSEELNELARQVSEGLALSAALAALYRRLGSA